MLKKLFSLFAALTLSAGLWALDNVPYIDADGTTKYANGVNVINFGPTTEQISWGKIGKTSWYVVENTGSVLSFTKGIICLGDVHLILADGSNMRTDGVSDDDDPFNNTPGFKVSNGNSLTIYGQTAQSGQLIAIGGEYCAGIGGGPFESGSNITINGGVILSKGQDGAGIGGGVAANGSDITINGGVIASYSTKAAGIGGGYAANGSDITINGGNVTAKGGNFSAGIGGGIHDDMDFGTGGQGSNIIINGGTVTATGGQSAAGIGGGKLGDGINIFIYGGNVIAEGGAGGAGIGGGTSAKAIHSGHGSNIIIYGGTVEATGGEAASAIGGGTGGDGSDITINGGTVTANGGQMSSGIGGGAGGNGYQITINDGFVTAIGGVAAAGIGGGLPAGPIGGIGHDIVINGGTIIASGGNALGMMGSAIGNGYSESLATPAYNIYISDAYNLFAGDAENPTEPIFHSSADDMSTTLTKQYAKIEGLAYPYIRRAEVGHWATVCLPYASTSFSGADFYKVNYYNGADSLFVEPVEVLEAGMPYLFEATSTTITIEHGPATLTYGDEINYRGLYGSFARKINNYDENYAYAALSSDTVRIIPENRKLTIPACRTYFDMYEVPKTEQPHSAPLRAVGRPRQTPTGMDNVNANDNVNKFILDGQMFIKKGNAIYNAQGAIINCQ